MSSAALESSKIYDVIIVGLGPVGCTLANCLAVRGHSVLVLEQSDLNHTNPRAITMRAPSMRLFQRIGLSEGVTAGIYPMGGAYFTSKHCYTEPGTPAMILNGRGGSADGTSDGGPGRWLGADLPVRPSATEGLFAGSFYQPQLERVLRDGLDRFPALCKQELGIQVTRFVEDADGVRVFARPSRFKWRKTEGHEYVFDDMSASDTSSSSSSAPAPAPPEPEQEFRGRFLIGCDGSSSSVRERINPEVAFGYTDLKFDERWLVVDVELRSEDLVGTKLPHAAQQICDPDRGMTIVPGARVSSGKQGRHWRWEFQVHNHESNAEMESFARLRRPDLLGRWLDPADYRIIRSACYRFHSLLAPQYRSRAPSAPAPATSSMRGKGGGGGGGGGGRVLLAGDAAHQMPPFFGMGLNTGLMDVANLEWKLSAVLKGEASAALLDTYEAEQQPLALSVIRASVGVGKLINAFRDADRDQGKAGLRVVSAMARGKVYDTMGGPPGPKKAKASAAKAKAKAKKGGAQNMIHVRPPRPQRWVVVDDGGGAAKAQSSVERSQPARVRRGQTLAQPPAKTMPAAVRADKWSPSVAMGHVLSDTMLGPSWTLLLSAGAAPPPPGSLPAWVTVARADAYVSPAAVGIEAFMRGAFLGNDCVLVRPDRVVFGVDEDGRALVERARRELLRDDRRTGGGGQARL